MADARGVTPDQNVIQGEEAKAGGVLANLAPKVSSVFNYLALATALFATMMVLTTSWNTSAGGDMDKYNLAMALEAVSGVAIAVTCAYIAQRLAKKKEKEEEEQTQSTTEKMKEMGREAWKDFVANLPKIIAFVTIIAGSSIAITSSWNVGGGDSEVLTSHMNAGIGIAVAGAVLASVIQYRRYKKQKEEGGEESEAPKQRVVRAKESDTATPATAAAVAIAAPTETASTATQADG